MPRPAAKARERQPQHWSPRAQYTLIQAFDPALGIDWPISEAAAIRSDKDRRHPPLVAVAPMEV